MPRTLVSLVITMAMTSVLLFVRINAIGGLYAIREQQWD